MNLQGKYFAPWSSGYSDSVMVQKVVGSNSGLGHLATENSLSTQQYMDTFIIPGKDKAKKVEGWALSFI